MPPLLLTTLKVIFLAILYLFVARAIRIIWLDLAGPRARAATPAPPKAAPAPRAPAQPPARSARASRSKGAAGAATLVVTEEGGTAKTVPLDGSEVTLGRAEECTVTLEDGYVSQMHTRIFHKDGTWFVADLGSTNGTFLNRIKVGEPMPLNQGDEVRLGKTIVEVRAR